MAMLVPLVALGAAAAPPAKPHILFIVSDVPWVPPVCTKTHLGVETQGHSSGLSSFGKVTPFLVFSHVARPTTDRACYWQTGWVS